MKQTKSTKRSTSKKPSGNKSLKALLISAVTSFAAVSALSIPQLANFIGIDHFDLSRITQIFTPEPAPVSVARPGGEQVQTSFKECPQFFPGKPPVVPAAQKLRELCFSSFAILHNGQTKTPVFVAQRLNRQMLEKAERVERKDRFYSEARLPQAERADLDDYRRSGYSRGHMAPAADMDTPEAMAQSFSLANMVPQDQRQNAGSWSKIEQNTRKYIMRAKGDVYVFTGPVYAGKPQTIGDGKVAVPSHVFKAVYDPSTGQSWVHLQENSPDAKDDAPISYESFVKQVGLRLLP